MTYTVTAGNHRLEIDAELVEIRPHDEIYRVKIDDTEKTISLARISPSHLSILSENQSYNVEVEKFENEYLVSIRGEFFKFSVFDELSSDTQESEDEISGSAVVTAPMPGLVVKVLVSVNDTVEANDQLLILEAMKMQNIISAKQKGKVIEVKISSGDSVSTGDVLIVLE